MQWINKNTNTLISEHDYNFLSDIQKEQCEIYIKDESLPVDNGWVSVEDRLPKFNVNVLACSKKGKIDISFVDASGKLDSFQLEVDNGKDYYTHWQPLPPLPSKEG